MSRQRRLAPPSQSSTAPAVIAWSTPARCGSDTPWRLSVSQDGRPAAPVRAASSLSTDPLTVYPILHGYFDPAEDARNVPLPDGGSPCPACVGDTAKAPVYGRVYRGMFLLSGSRTCRPNRAVVAPAQISVALFLPTTRRPGPQAFPPAKFLLTGQDLSRSGRDPVGRTHEPSTSVYGRPH